MSFLDLSILNKISNKEKIALIFLIILTILLFVGGPGYESHRLFKKLWDTGHLFLFAIISYLMLTTLLFANYHINKRIILVMMFCLFFGLSIENIQYFIGRSYEVNDIYADLIGAIIGVTVYYQNNISINKLFRYHIFFLQFVLVSIGLFPLISSGVDELSMRKEFPVLADFESKFEISRWDINKAKITLSNKYIRSGKSSLKVKFLPDKYPDVTLKHFYRDWSGYKKLNFSIFNAMLNTTELQIKIYDSEHSKRKYNYSDRYNETVLLKSGWNDLSINIDDICSSPKDRKMKCFEVESFSLFINNLKTPATIYIDNIILM